MFGQDSHGVKCIPFLKVTAWSCIWPHILQRRDTSPEFPYCMWQLTWVILSLTNTELCRQTHSIKQSVYKMLSHSDCEPPGTSMLNALDPDVRRLQLAYSSTGGSSVLAKQRCATDLNVCTWPLTTKHSLSNRGTSCTKKMCCVLFRRCALDVSVVVSPPLHIICTKGGSELLLIRETTKKNNTKPTSTKHEKAPYLPLHYP